jgi:predicted MFS family arabinose efflux permease
MMPDTPQKLSRTLVIYAVALITVVMIFNQIDRYVLFILIEPIRTDLGLSDGQLGILTGLAFAIAYSAMAIPVGRMADRYNRSHLAGAAMLTWSLGTAAFGLASGFGQLLGARVAVAAGEGASYSPLQSQIADLVAPHRRSLIIAITSFGAVAGIAGGYILAATLNEAIGWRHTFIVIGGAGCLFAPLVYFTLPEPVRGCQDSVTIDPAAQPSLAAAAHALWQRPAFLLLLTGLALAGIAAYGTAAWTPTFYMRRYAISTTEVATLSSAYQLLPSALGTLAGGFVTPWLAKRDARWQLWFPGICLILAFPSTAAQLHAATVGTSALFSIIPNFVTGLFVAPALAALHGLAGARLRGTGTALVSISLLLIGQGLGPLLTGMLSDRLGVVDGGAGLTAALLAISAAFALGGAALLAAAVWFRADMDRAQAFDEAARWRDKPVAGQTPVSWSGSARPDLGEHGPI